MKKGNIVKIFSDHKHDITHKLPTAVKQMKELTDSDIVLDSEMVLYDGKTPLGRSAATKFLMSKENQNDKQIKFFVFDVLYYRENLMSKPWYERYAVRQKLGFKHTPNLINVPSVIVDNKEDALKAIHMFAKMVGSEGAMIKKYEGTYTPNGKTDAWVKFRKELDIHVVVIDKILDKAGIFNYLVGVYATQEDLKLLSKEHIVEVNGKPVLQLGKTFNTKIQASKGDLLDIHIEEIWREQDKDGIHYSIHKPKVLEKIEMEETTPVKELDDMVVARGAAVKNEELQDVSEEGGTRSEAAKKFWAENWYKSFPKSGHGSFIYHHHYRGVAENEISYSEPEMISKTDNSVHGDLRCQANDKYLWGFTVFTGSTKDLEKAGGCRLCNLDKNEKLEGAFKLLEPISWVRVGLNKPYISAPGKVGSTKNYYAKFFAVDHGTYDMGVWRKHSFEIFLHGNKLKGRYIIQFAPVGGRRIWLISKPENEKPYADTHKLEDVMKELKSKGQKWLVWAKPGTKPKLIEIR